MEGGGGKRFCSALNIEGKKVVGVRGDKRDVINVVIPDGIDEIGDCAFVECDALASVVMPNSVTSIGKRTFECCGPNSLTFGANLILDENVL